MATPTVRILCYDCDAFYVQCARLAWPDRLRGVERLLVGGHPDRRGVVAACSYATRGDGVRSGIPMAAALRLCPDAVATPVPWAVVRRKSREVRAVVRGFAEAWEWASVDEGYLTVALPGDDAAAELERRAREIQRAVAERAGITISLGGAARRFIAKMATAHAKPGGVHVVPDGEEERFVAAHELGDIPGVGPAFVDALARRGVSSVAAARRIELRILIHWLGPARARFLFQRVRGIDDHRIGEQSGERKSVSSETTFARDVNNDAELRATLGELADDVCRTLRREGLRARTLGVKLRESDFTDHQRTLTLREAVDDPELLVLAAERLFAELRREHPGPVRLLGLATSRLLGPGSAEQLALDGVLPSLEEELRAGGAN